MPNFYHSDSEDSDDSNQLRLPLHAPPYIVQARDVLLNKTRKVQHKPSPSPTPMRMPVRNKEVREDVHGMAPKKSSSTPSHYHHYHQHQPKQHHHNQPQHTFNTTIDNNNEEPTIPQPPPHTKYLTAKLTHLQQTYNTKTSMLKNTYENEMKALELELHADSSYAVAEVSRVLGGNMRDFVSVSAGGGGDGEESRHSPSRRQGSYSGTGVERNENGNGNESGRCDKCHDNQKDGCDTCRERMILKKPKYFTYPPSLSRSNLRERGNENENELKNSKFKNSNYNDVTKEIMELNRLADSPRSMSNVNGKMSVNQNGSGSESESEDGTYDEIMVHDNVKSIATSPDRIKQKTNAKNVKNPIAENGTNTNTKTTHKSWLEKKARELLLVNASFSTTDSSSPSVNTNASMSVSTSISMSDTATMRSLHVDGGGVGDSRSVKEKGDVEEWSFSDGD